jgi:sugar lactone lactonase YvrE
LAILGPPIADPSVAVTPGDIIVANGVGGQLILVDPATGTQTVISSGRFLSQPSGLAIDATGNLIVADQQAFGGGGGLIRVDPVTGQQTAISSGGLFINPAAVVIDSLGQLIVTDFTSAAVIRVDPVTGTQSVISSGGFFTHPWGIAIDKTGNFVVADAGASTSGSCANCGLIRVDAVTGAQTLISTAGFFATPTGVAVEAFGSLIVADAHGFGGQGGLIRVDPITGAQSVITSGGLFWA